MWSAIFKQMGARYVPPKLVLYRDRTSSACGRANAAVGPFYCPADRDLYLDTSFFNQLSTRFGAPGEFAQAYVIAHEVGHHVQNQLGISDKVHQARHTLGDAQYNQQSVRLELQADFLAEARVRILMVVGNRESKQPGIGERVERFLIIDFKSMEVDPRPTG